MEQDGVLDRILGEFNRAEPDNRGFALAHLLVEILAEGQPENESLADFHDLVQGRRDSQAAFFRFIMLTLENSEPADAQLDQLVQLCSSHGGLWALAFHICGSNLVNITVTIFAGTAYKVSILQRSQANSKFATLKSIEPRFRREFGTPNDAPFATFLSFFKSLLIKSCKQAISIPIQWLVLLAFLVGAKNEVIAGLAKEILLLMIYESDGEAKHFTDETSDYNSTFLICHLWSRIFELAGHPLEESHYVNHGLVIWLRLLSLRSDVWRPNPITDDYWDTLRSFLAEGTTEQRKMCLAILNLSVSKLSAIRINSQYFFHVADDSTAFEAHFRRFISVYETVVIARYLNQVHDALSDLTWFTSRDSLVSSSWIVLLLHASLGPGMQDSIQNLIGYWTMQNGGDSLSSAANTAYFLEHAFLPWAVKGSHFMSSIVKSPERGISCTFGEELVEFLTRAIVTSTNKRIIIEAMLRYLAWKENKIFPYSRAFILEGLSAGVIKSQFNFNSVHANSIARIACSRGFADVVCDLTVLLTTEICLELGPLDDETERLLSEARKSVLQVPQRSLQDKYSSACQWFVSDVFKHETKSESAPSLLRYSTIDEHPFQQLVSWIRQSNRACLRGRGLQAACDFVQGALAKMTEAGEADSHALHEVLELIWSEIEAKGHPRFIMRDFVAAAFHPKCMRQLSPESALTFTLSKIAVHLLKLSTTRVYIFAPLARVLRRAVLFIEPAQNLPLADLFEMYVKEPPKSRIEFDLEKIMSVKLERLVPEKNYEFFYGEPEGLGHACFFDILNSLPMADCRDVVYWTILDTILEKWVQQKEPVPAFSPWKTTAQLQVMVLAFHRLVPKISIGETEIYLSKLHRLLEIEQMPRYRFLLEWIAVRVYVALPNRRLDVAQKLSNSTNDIENPKYTVSMIKIAVKLACLQGARYSYALQLMTSLSALATSQKVAVRYEAQWALPKLWRHANNQQWNEITTNPVFQMLNFHIERLEMYENPPPNRHLEEFDPVRDHNLVFLLHGQYLQIEPKEVPLASYKDLVAAQSRDVMETRIQHLEVKKIHNSFLHDSPGVKADHIVSRENTASTSPLQMKSNVLQADMQMTQDQRHPNSVIVIASLIDSPYNLGGISRTSEIFGVKTLFVNKLDVLKSKEFTGVSVASHLWLPVESLPVVDIPAFLQRCKTDGWKVVGIEQTDSSKVLGKWNCPLPRQLVLVPGSEKQGIPADLLSEMDFCVEIKQLGVTRSMNVQTALSVALFEYQRQHNLKE